MPDPDEPTQGGSDQDRYGDDSLDYLTITPPPAPPAPPAPDDVAQG